MPRSSKLELPGCPRLRLLCCDSLGLIKVIEAETEGGTPTVVGRWGQPDSRRAIRCISLSERAVPRLAVARKTNIVEVLDSGTGAVHSELLVPNDPRTLPERGVREGDNGICGLHLLREEGSRGLAVLTCTENGKATLRRLASEGTKILESHAENDAVTARWNVSQSGTVLSMDMDGGEQYAVFGGNGVEVNLWDAAKSSKVWSAKAPHRDNLGLMSPAWFTAVTFLGADDHRKIVAGTGHHQVRLYDIGAQRRPTLSFDYGESPIKTVTRDADGVSVFVGTGGGDLGCFDMRMGRLVGGFKGKCAGSVRSVARHSTLPIIASCGLDRYLRLHNTKTRQLLASLFLKQQLTAVVFDVEENMSTKPSVAPEAAVESESGDLEFLKVGEDLELVAKRKRVKPVEKRLRVTTASPELKGVSAAYRVDRSPVDELELYNGRESKDDSTARKKNPKAPKHKRAKRRKAAA